jgi:hypothetical protein
MRFAKNNHISTPLNILLMLLLLIQPFSFSLAMAQSDSPAHHASTAPEHQHTEHSSADQPRTQHNEDASMAGDCCASAVCCPAVTNTRTPKMPMANTLTQFEFQVSFHTITLPIEIKPPRLFFAS